MNRKARGWPSPRRIVTLRPEQRGLHPAVEVGDGAAVEQDRVLDLGALDRAVRADRGVRADVAVDEPGAGADDRRAADGAALEPGAGLDTTRPSQRESTSSPSIRPSIVSRTRRLASSMSSRRPVSFHQPRTMCGSTRSPRVDEVLDRVGDLELAARRSGGSRAPRRGSPA